MFHKREVSCLNFPQKVLGVVSKICGRLWESVSVNIHRLGSEYECPNLLTVKSQSGYIEYNCPKTPQH